MTYLGLQTFIAARGRGRWLAHQLLFWGVVLATLITFPLTFGWFAFFSDTATGPEYTIYLLGFRTVSFDALSPLGWLIFHGLDVAAVMVIAGCVYFFVRRVRNREATTGERFGYDFLPLIGLVAISVTGLLLTFSSWLLEGRSSDFLAITHMAAVVLTLVFIPFGKFFHVIQRPASVGGRGLQTDLARARRCLLVPAVRRTARGQGLRRRPEGDDGRARTGVLRVGETCPCASGSSGARPTSAR